MRALSLVFVAALLLGGACQYSPEIESGKLKCSSPGSECPEGFSCTDGLCYKAGEGPGAGGHGGSGAGGRGGSGGGGDLAGKFLGHWVFGSPTPQTIACSGGVTMNGNLAGDFIDVVRSTPADLSTHYYCDWSLNADSTGAKAILVPGTSCSGTDPYNPTITYTWHGERFTIASTGANTATLDASIPYDYVLAGANVSCTMTITSSMTKGNP
jgi:hypothetical protein